MSDKRDYAIAELLFVLKHRCEFHHVPLHNGWAHILHRPTGTKKTVKCQLSLTERDAIRRAEAAQ